MTLQIQFFTMGMMIASGMAMGVVFDTYRVLTGQLRAPRWLLPLFDLLYWTGVTLFVFRMLYMSNYGRLRFFVFVGLALGVVLYFFLLSRAVSASVMGIYRAVVAIIRFIRKLIVILIIRPLIVVYKIILALLGFLLTVTIFLLRVVVQLLYPVRIIFSPLFKWARQWSWPKRIGKMTRRIYRWVQRLFD